METISLLVKSRNGVVVNETQLFYIDDIVGPINPSSGGADSIFVYREGKKGPFSTSPGGSFLTTFVVDQTVAQIEVLGIAIFTANVISQSGRLVLNTPIRGFNANYICGPVKPFNGGSAFSYQEDTNSDLVDYIVTQTPAQILIQIQFTGGSGGGTGDITGDLTANHLPVATSAKNLTDTLCTYISNTLTLRGADASNIITIGNAGISIASSILSLTSGSTVSIAAIGKIAVAANGISINQILSVDSLGYIISVNVSPTQLLYVNSFTSNPQNQIDNKIGGSLTAGLMPYASAAKVISDTQLFFDGTSKWGFMTVSPTNTVHINGTFRLVDGSQAAGKILSCDLNGVASWIVAPAAGMTNVLTTTGDIIQANPGSTPSRLASVATGNVLISGGVGTINSWGKVGLTTHVNGILLPVNGGSGTSTVMTPGSILFAGTSGIYSQDNANLFYDSANAAVRLGGATYNTAVLNVKSPLGKNALHIDISTTTGGYAALITTHADTSTGYVTSSTGSTSALFINTSTAINTNSMIRFRNGGVDSAVLGTLYVDGSSSNFVLGISKASGDITHSSIYIKGATTAVGIGYDFKSPTATLHVIGSTTNQSSLRIGVATALPTGTFRFAGDINFTTQRYYGYKTDNTPEEAFAYLSDITGLFVRVDGTTPLTANWNAGPFAITANGVIIGGSVTGVVVNGTSIGMTITVVGDGIQVNTAGRGVVINADTVGGQFTSINTAGKFLQSGTLGSNSTSHVVSIIRDIVLNGNTNTGSMLYMNNVTASTGDFITITSNGTVKVAIKSTGVLQYIDGSQAAGKVLTSDVNGNASWTTPSTGFTNPMTTIGDIIQANTGGTPQRLGNSTTGTYLRSVSGGLNVWSTLVLPNVANSNEVFFSTSSNTMGSLPEFTYTVSTNTLALLKNNNGDIRISTQNLSSGAAARAVFYAAGGTGNIAVGSTSTGYTGAIGSDNLIIDGNGGNGLVVNHNNNIKFTVANTEYARFQNGGLMIGVAAAPDIACLIDMQSTTKGLRIPRMTTAQKNAITTTGKPGLIVFDTDLNKYCGTDNAGTWGLLN